jgi:hypothetical protein
MGCCLAKKAKKPQTAARTVISPVPEAPIANSNPVVEHAKLWLQDSPKKEEKIE